MVWFFRISYDYFYKLCYFCSEMFFLYKLEVIKIKVINLKDVLINIIKLFGYLFCLLFYIFKLKL